ncbi:MAG: precorrin-3B C(17)-methyltransferase [Candidatus Pelethousia sp.]|nr:precorrin-3B C(17)-methyltransferase [Candidatus Pelethousia sp.]
MTKLYVVGIGPGNRENMTPACRAALEQADVAVGYTKYIELIKPLYPHKPIFATPMLGEVERCRKALELAAGGKTVAVVCSGDAGVYGMAGLVLELAGEYPPVDIEIVPGITAALAGAAVLGAPLTHDFAIISLSDLLTPGEVIEKRLACAAKGDFCMALYNPASKRRADYLSRACDILLQYKAADTLCGFVRNIGREGEQKELMPLSELGGTEVDMFTTVFIGNVQTRRIAGRMVTPRGYRFD